MTSLEQLKAQATQGFEKIFNQQATVFAASPGRVNLIGEHIDYCDGFVMPFALEQNVLIAAAPNGTSSARLSSAISEEIVEVPLSGDIKEEDPKWANYPRGVMQYFREATGCRFEGFDAYVVSNVPRGGGLSSSAALECAFATLLEGLTGHSIDTKTKALLCQKAEHNYAHVPCGIMDQFASAFGQEDRLVMIDCQTGEPTLIPFENPDLTVIIANTCVSHELSDGGYATRRKATETGLEKIGKASWRDVSADDLEAAKVSMTEKEYNCGKHVISEIQRVVDAAGALNNSDFAKLGELMYASHASLRDDFEVSCKELDTMVEIAQSIGQAGGVIGARMTGGGFGGSTVTLVESKHSETILETMRTKYTERTGITPEIFTSRPCAGSRLIS